jgi:hypothetical protein
MTDLKNEEVIHPYALLVLALRCGVKFFAENLSYKNKRNNFEPLACKKEA